MTSTISPLPSIARRTSRRADRLSARADRAHAPRPCAPLGRYTDAQGHPREVLALPGSCGSLLVVDRDAATLRDRRLLAHLEADEPSVNAVLVCRCYLREQDERRRRCRRVVPEDFRMAPFAPHAEGDSGKAAGQGTSVASDMCFRDRGARIYRLDLLPTTMSIPQLRWCHCPPPGVHGVARHVSVREVIACLESYEPIRTLTLGALARYRNDPAISTTLLRSELERVQESPIVLNRGLRQAVLAMIERQGLSLSEIAIRCGRVRRDAKGNENGDTSWLARRIGILSEGGADRRTPWIHSDVLALIARRGLGISPHEVELG